MEATLTRSASPKTKTGVVRPVERPELLQAFAAAAQALTVAQLAADEAREAKWQLEEQARSASGAARRKHVLELLLSEELRRLAALDLGAATAAAHEAAQAVYRALLGDVRKLGWVGGQQARWRAEAEAKLQACRERQEQGQRPRLDECPVALCGPVVAFQAAGGPERSRA